jgi:hypothetical protein
MQEMTHDFTQRCGPSAVEPARRNRAAVGADRHVAETAGARHAASLFVGSTALRGPLLKMCPDGFMSFADAEVKSVLVF